MNFGDFEIEVQEHILKLLDSHISASIDLIKSDGTLLPVLLLPDSEQLISLQPTNEITDVDKAYAVVVDRLKGEKFSYALFSYSTQIGLADGKMTDAIKSIIFISQGIEVSFFTPYSQKGLFKKTITTEKTIFGGINEHIFD